MLVKRVILVILALVLVGVWLRNLFLLVPESTADPIQTPSPGDAKFAGTLTSVTRDTAFIYVPAERDPFALPLENRPQLTKTAGPSRPLPATPSIRASLLGHVWTAGDPYIIVFDSLTGASRLLRPSDSLNGFTLTRVSRHEIRWRSPKGPALVWTTEP